MITPSARRPPSSLRPHAVGEVRQSGWLEGLRILRHCKGFGHLPPVRILDPSELYNQSAHVRITRSPYSRPPIRLSGSMKKCIKLCGPSWYLNAKYDLLKNVVSIYRSHRIFQKKKMLSPTNIKAAQKEKEEKKQTAYGTRYHLRRLGQATEGFERPGILMKLA